MFITIYYVYINKYKYHGTSNYGWSHTNALNTLSHLAARLKRTVTKINVQYTASHVISCHQNSPLASQIIKSV